MNDAELRRGIAEWFDSAQKVAQLLNGLDSDIREYYLYHLKPRDETTKALRAIPKPEGEHETYGEWLDEMFEHNARKIDRDFEHVRKIVNLLGSIKKQWLGDRLLLAFPTLGFFELESHFKGSGKQRWKFAWDRLFSAFEMIELIWPMVKEYPNAKSEFRRVCDISPEEFDNGLEIAASVGVGALSDSHLEAIENRLFTEMAQVLRDLNSENHTQNPQNTPGNESPKPGIDPQNIQIKDALSEDKRTLTWGGKSYPLGTNASRLVEKLLEVYPRSLHQEYLKTNCEFDSDIRNIVRDGKLQDVVVRAVGEVGKNIPGMWRLSDPK